MPMKNPPHPGGFVLRQCIEPLGLTITDAAEALGVTRTTLSELVNEKRGISPEMAVRLSKAFGGSGPKAGLRNRHNTTWRTSVPTVSRSSGWSWLRHGASAGLSPPPAGTARRKQTPRR